MRQINKLFLYSGFFMIANLVCSPVHAARSDDDFREYVKTLCETNIEFIAVFENFLLCTGLFQGSAVTSSEERDSIIVLDAPTLGTTGSTTVKNRFEQLRLENQGNTTVSAGAGNDFGFFDGGFGVFAADLSGETDRAESALENGFNSDQDASTFGLDYRFFDFILGVAIGSIDNDVLVANGGGNAQSESDSEIVYATWAATDNLSLDVYRGNVDSMINIRRNVDIPTFDFLTGLPDTIPGVITGSTTSEQSLQGFSINFDHYVDAWLLGTFFELDSIETETNGYDEEGRRDSDPTLATGLELSYPRLKTESETRSLGLRLGYNADFGWGTLSPNLKLATVRESKARGQEIAISLRAAPDTAAPFSVATDDADRYYQLTNFSLVALLANGSVQIFLDYEKRSGDRYLDSSATTMGVLIGF